MTGILRKLNRWADEYPLAVYVCLVIGAGVGAWQIEDARDDSQGQNEQTLGSIIAVQIQNCKNDRRFREQYRKRGEAEKALIGLFLQLARRNVAEGKDPTGESQAFLDRFGPLAREIHVIPIPDCREVGKSLREVIQNTGVDIPPIPELEKLVSPSRPGGSNTDSVRSPTPGGDALQPGSTGRQQPDPPRGGPPRRRGARAPRPTAPADSPQASAPSGPVTSAIPAPSLLPPQSNGKGTPDPPPQAQGPIGSAVDALTDLGCKVTHPLTGVCLR